MSWMLWFSYRRLLPSLVQLQLLEKTEDRTSVCSGVENCTDDAWYKINLRVSRDTFNAIVKILEEFALEKELRVPAKNAYVEMRMRVAMTLSYLSQEGGFSVKQYIVTNTSINTSSGYFS